MKKKALAAMMASVMVLSFAACGSTNDGGETKTADGTEAATETAAEGETETAAEAAEEIPYFSAFDYEDITKYVTLGEYESMEVPAQDRTVTDEAVEERMQSDLDSYNSTYAEYEQITDRKVAEGDTVNLDYSGVLAGETEPFEGGTDTGATLKIGSGQFIDGFEAGLEGVMPGETVELNLTFPTEYSESLAGKDVVFTCTVNYIEGDQILYEMNDETVALITSDECKTVDEYRAYEREQLESEAETTAESNIVNEYWARILNNCEYKEEPTELIDYICASEMENLEYNISMYGYDLETYLSMVGETQEELEAEIRDYAVQKAESMVTICAIVKAAGLELNEEEMNTALEELADSVGATKDDLVDYYGEAYLKDIIYQDKVQEYMEANAVEVEGLESAIEEETSAE